MDILSLFFNYIYIVIKINFIIILFFIKGKFMKEKIIEYPIFQIDEYKKIFDSINNNDVNSIFRKKNKIENIFILISIFPFLKKEITIRRKNPIYNFLKNILDYKGNESIKISKNNQTLFSLKINESLFYQWEYLPDKNRTNYIRHILYHFYLESCLDIFEKALNLNINYYLVYYREKLTYESINDLISKYICNKYYR